MQPTYLLVVKLTKSWDKLKFMDANLKLYVFI